MQRSKQIFPYFLVRAGRWLLPFLSWLWLWFRQRYRAALSAPGITLTLLSGLLPLLLGTVRLWIPYVPWATTTEVDLEGPVMAWLNLPVALTMVGLLVLFLPVAGVIVLWRARPEDYAQILISGRPAVEVFGVIARDISKVCRRLEKVLNRAPKPISTEATKKDAVPAFVRRLERTGKRQHLRLKRLEQMKRRAAVELDIPTRRVCDHIFQYSPSIHENRLENCIRKWKQILAHPRDNLGIDIGAHRDPYLDNTAKRVEFQKQLLIHRDLHYHIQTFASSHSTSGSLQIYAEALSHVARRYLRDRNGYFPLSSAGGNALRYDLADRLLFLFRKQKSHPGFDLHSLILRFLGGETKASETPSDSVENQGNGGKGRSTQKGSRSDGEAESTIDAQRLSEFLTHVRDHSSRRRIGLAGDQVQSSSIRKRAETFFEGTEWVKDEPLKTLLEQLIVLPVALNHKSRAMKRTIRKRFWDLYEEWVRRTPASTNATSYIVTHGYSRTVRSILTPSGDEPDSEQDDFKLFFMLPGADQNGHRFHSLDTRILEYELKEDSRFRRERLMAAGPWEILGKLLKKGDRVLILLGAECFDRQGRVVHARGVADQLPGFLRSLEDKKIPAVVVVVAESYKTQGDNYTLAQDANFFGQHFDQVDLYPAKHIHLIVTDDGSLPAVWREVLGSRVKASE